MIFNLPNMITIARIFLVPVFLAIFWSPSPNHVLLGMGVLGIAGITDMIDGYVARKYNLITPLGKILDPAADKLIVITVMTSLFLVGKFPLWLVGLILAKELVIALGGSFLVLKEKIEIGASIYGKAATISIYLALFFYAFEIRGSTIISVIAGFVSVLALVNYINSFIRRRVY